MIKKVCLIGHSGNMGRRYGRILDFLRIPWQGIDLVNLDNKIHEDVDGFIIATPTSSHYSDILKYSSFGKPILCEKPITKNESEFYKLMSLDIELSIINQYRYFFEKTISGEKEATLYSYYNSGADGLLWDCINLVGMAEGDICLSKKDHVWKCVLNGNMIDRRDIDESYVWNISGWLDGSFVESKRFMINSFDKVLTYEKEARGCHWNTGEEIFITSSGKIYKNPCATNNVDRLST